MANVTASQVKQIVATDLEDYQILKWCDAASAIVSDNADQIGDQDRQDQVELFLSAHFVAMLDSETRGFATSTSLEGFTKTFAATAKVQELINSTPHGSAANALANGCLADADKPRAKVVFL